MKNRDHLTDAHIDNWAHLRRRPKRICGVFVVASFRDDLCFGNYFASTKVASRALGYSWDRVGATIRKNRGTRDEGYARLQVWFMSAKAALERGPWYLEFFVQRWFPWLFEGRRPSYKLVFLPGGVSWVRNDEPQQAPAPCATAAVPESCNSKG